MADQLYPLPRNGGNKRRIRASDTSQTDLTDEARTIWTKKVPADRRLGHGHGVEDRDNAEAFVYADLQDSTPSAIQGTLVLAILDSQQRDVLYRREFGDLDELQESQNESRSDQIVQPLHAPVATEDKYIALRVISDSGNVTYTPSNSSIRLFYTDLPS